MIENNPPSPENNQKKTIIIVVIVLVALLVLTCIGLATYFAFKTWFAGESSSDQLAGYSGAPTSTPAEPASQIETLQLEDYNGGFFSIQKPQGWQVSVGGNCATFSFVIRDPSHPERMIFYFGEVGPVYLNEHQKALDQEYMSMGGYTLEWVETSVVNPLTPENFLKSISALAQTNFIKKFMTEIPQLNEVEIISANSEKSIVGQGEAKIMRALFKENGVLDEGQFYVAVSEMLPYTGMAAGGIGYGFSFTGLAAGKKDFSNLEKKLAESLGTFNISQDYVNNCIAQQNQTYERIMQAGKTLSETSDIIMSSWEYKNRTDDILSERRSDVMLGNDRVYNPDTGSVYEVGNGWYDDYNSSREKYNMNNLQQLPGDNWDLWTAPTKNGNEIN